MKKLNEINFRLIFVLLCSSLGTSLVPLAFLSCSRSVKTNALLNPQNLTVTPGPSASPMIINNYGYISSPFLISGNSSVVVETTGKFSPGDTVLVLQTQNVLSNINSTAQNGTNYEYINISAVQLITNPVHPVTLPSATPYSVTFSTPLTNAYYTGIPNSLNSSIVTQLVSVPTYSNVTVPQNSYLGAQPWNGLTGGILSFVALGTLSVAGTMTVSGNGFQGGSLTYASGESWTGFATPLSSSSFPVNNGGGGSLLNYSLGSFTVNCGGGGGYGTNGSNCGETAATSCSLYTNLCGNSYGSSQLSSLYLGSGGGAAVLTSGSHGQSSAGTPAGGMILAFVNNLSLPASGVIQANGLSATGSTNSTGYYDARVGSGSGGTIYIVATALGESVGTISALGGVSVGIPNYSSTYSVFGGQGGSGRIRLDLPNSSAAPLTSPSAYFGSGQNLLPINFQLGR